MQEQIKAGTEAITSFGNLKEKFENISSRPVTRDVRLIYSSCCGCGCSDMDISRTVPYDSPLKDGDRAAQLNDSDVIL